MYTTRLVFRNNETHMPLMQQSFNKTFKTIRAAAKFLETKVEGMTAITLEPDIRIFGQVMHTTSDNITCIDYAIALF